MAVSEALDSWAEPALLTAEQLMYLPEDGWHYELVEGRLLREPPPGWEHGTTPGGLYAAMHGFVMARGLGRVALPETGFNLTKPGDKGETVLAPDIAFVRTEHLPVPGTPDYKGYPHVAPDLVVETASPSQYRPGMARKARRWLGARARLVWVIWPSMRRVDVWRPGATAPTVTLRERDVLDGEDVLPGFTYPIAELFK